MKRIAVGIMLLLLTVAGSVAPAQEKKIVAGWGSGYGAFGRLIAPSGAQRGPQSICAATDGRLFILDTFNNSRVMAYNRRGEIQQQITNQFPSSGYVDLEIEQGQILYLLDLSRNAVNRIDLEDKSQKLITAEVLGVSGEITLISKDLKGKVYVRDDQEHDLALDLQYKGKLLAFKSYFGKQPTKHLIRWTNAGVAFPIEFKFPIISVEYRGFCPTRGFFLEVEIQTPKQRRRRMVSYDSNGWKKRLQELKPRGNFHYQKASCIDDAGRIYQLVCSEEGVQVLMWK